MSVINGRQHQHRQRRGDRGGISQQMWLVPTDDMSESDDRDTRGYRDGTG